ncbi:MAG: hypothetical protein JWO56_1297 [Acidobacteria bacterium]|nr:hypothetical protein [Acidobacteriota bacterium]
MKILISLMFSLLFAVPPGFRQPAQSPARPIRTPQESAARALLANITAGRFEDAAKDFNPTMKVTVPPSLLAEMKKQFDEELGAFQIVTEARVEKENAPNANGQTWNSQTWNIPKGGGKMQTATSQTATGVRSVELIARYAKSLASFKVAFDENQKIAAVYFNKIVPEPVDPLLEASARELLAHFTAGRFDEVGKNFNQTLHALMTPAVLADVSRQVTDTFGTFHSVTGVIQRSGKDFREIEFTTIYDQGRVLALVVFDNEGKVKGVRFSTVKNALGEVEGIARP